MRKTAEVDRVISEFPNALHSSAKADQRVFGANNVSCPIDDFAHHPSLEMIATAYNRVSTRTAFTCCKDACNIGNHGSGEGWHRDAFMRQFKAICTYLMLDRTMDRSSLLKILISLFKFFVIFGMEPLITSNIDYLWMRLNVLLKILPNALLLILLKQELLYWSIPAPFTVECLYLRVHDMPSRITIIQSTR